MLSVPRVCNVQRGNLAMVQKKSERRTLWLAAGVPASLMFMVILVDSVHGRWYSYKALLPSEVGREYN